MQYISRSEAREKYGISLVTIDKYLKLGRIYRTRKKGQYYIDAVALEEYIKMKNQIGGPFENKTLFEEPEAIGNSEKNSVEQKEPGAKQEQKTELAMIAGFQGIIQSKDDLLEQKNKVIENKEKHIRYWSNGFFIMFVLFVCSVLFLLYILQ